MVDNNTNIEQKELSSPFDFFNKEKDNILDLDKDDITPEAINSSEEEIDSPEETNVQDSSEEVERRSVESNTPEETEESEEKPTEDSEEPEANEEGEEEYEVELTGNITKLFAEKLKAENKLPEDFEVRDDITEEELDKAYITFREDSLRNEVEREVRDKLAEEEGLTPQMIEEIKMKYYGVQDPEIQELQSLKGLSEYQFDIKSDSFEQDARDFLTIYYQMKGMGEKTLNKTVESNLDDDDLVDILQEAQVSLKGDYNKLENQISSKLQAEKEQRARNREKQLEQINSLLKSGKINGVQYNPKEMEEVRKALFEKTETVKGADGKMYKVTKYHKKKLERSNSLEKDLQDKITFLLGSDLGKIREEEREKTKGSLLKGLNDYVGVKKKKSNKSNRNNNSSSTNIERKEIA